jgi:GxxExxY protein
MDAFTNDVIGCAIEVHKQLGAGLLESSYECCLMHELSIQGMMAHNQVVLPIHYKGVDITTGYRLDILIPGKLVIELKAVDRLMPVHTAQLLTYLKLTGIKRGLIINFNVPRLVDGIKRVSL